MCQPQNNSVLKNYDNISSGSTNFSQTLALYIRRRSPENLFKRTDAVQQIQHTFFTNKQSPPEYTVQTSDINQHVDIHITCYYTDLWKTEVQFRLLWERFVWKHQTRTVANTTGDCRYCSKSDRLVHDYMTDWLTHSFTRIELTCVR